MRKIEKDLSDIPKSLRGTANSKRNSVISKSGYPKGKSKKFDDQYKKDDTRKLLIRIYHNKCAYCERKLLQNIPQNIKLPDEVSTIDHYRPKNSYYWLAFSWDNLLLCCHRCGDNKDNNFDIVNQQVTYSKSFNRRIHKSTRLYNRLENPKMIHPELEDIIDKLVFDTNGNIDSKDDRVKYTISTCGLDRNYLNGERKKIWDDFKKKIDDSIAQDNKGLMDKIIKEFKEDSENMDNEFIAFRSWVLISLSLQ